MTGEPYPKGKQLARGERRYRRKVATAKQWQKIVAAKQGACRICTDPASNGKVHSHIEFHHLISRARGGDDVEENIVPLCSTCHEAVSREERSALDVLAISLTGAEYAYIIDKLGEGAMERLFRV